MAAEGRADCLALPARCLLCACPPRRYVGVTRFEDDARLPLGIAINSASFAAKALTHVRGGRTRSPLPHVYNCAALQS